MILCNMCVESKMMINRYQNIGSNISNSNENIIANIDKKKKRLFLSSELNEIVRFWDFESLRVWEFESLRFWDFDNSNVRMYYNYW
jgi:hypothetical protein